MTVLEGQQAARLMPGAHMAVRLVASNGVVGMLLLLGWSSAGHCCWRGAPAPTELHSVAAEEFEAARLSSWSRPAVG